MESEYICDDRIFEPGGLMDQIRAMSDEEFEQFIAEQKKKEQKMSEEIRVTSLEKNVATNHLF